MGLAAPPCPIARRSAPRLLLLAGLLLTTALPARSAPVASDEPLVMRIIFEDCLGYVRNGRTPFRGLATRPASAAAIEQLPVRMPDREKAVELLSPRYVASWGEDADGRHCFVGVFFAALEAGVPVRLGVPAGGFLRHATLRARAAGLTEAMVADGLSPLATSVWSEPDTGHDRGPLRPVSVSVLATTPADARGIAEAGLIVMGGPPGGRPHQPSRAGPDRPFHPRRHPAIVRPEQGSSTVVRMAERRGRTSARRGGALGVAGV